MHRTLLTILAGLLITGIATAAAAKSWRVVTRTDGITVSVRDDPSGGFPTFKGVGVVYGSIYHVAAVISDVPRHTQWMGSCKHARILRREGELVYVIYSQTDAPWPVSDRDAVYHSRATVTRPGKELVIRFKAIRTRAMPRKSGYVRMENLRGHFKLRALSNNRTWLEYQVDADPGGWLPRWLARLAARRLPLDSIRKLRLQVKRTRGRYDARIRRWKQMQL